MAVILTIFLVVPMLAPMIGQALLQLGSWRYTFAVGPVFGTLVALWSTRVTESLDPSKRSTLDMRSIGRSIVEVLRTRSVLGNTVALTMLTAAFLPYLASSERIYGEVYDRGSQFFLWFGGTSIVMAGFTLATSRIVARRGTKRTMRGVIALLLVISTANAVVTLGTGGTPPFAFFFVATTLAVSLNTAASPLLTSRALDEVGRIAGTAASTIGAISFIGAALLSPLVDGAIDTTVTPFAVGYLTLAAVAAVWADRRRSAIEPIAVGT